MMTNNNINISDINLGGIDLSEVKLGVLSDQTGSIPGLTGLIGLWDTKGLTNESMAANPVWLDKSGCGNDLQLKNFGWKLNSGIGIYEQDFNNFVNNSSESNVIINEKNGEAITFTVVNPIVFNALSLRNYNYGKSFKIKTTSTGFQKDDIGFYFSPNAGIQPISIKIEPNGITELPAINKGDFYIVYFYVNRKVGTITIEQIPEYQNAICFDGVEDFGICETFPILTKEKGYTVIALRKLLNKNQLGVTAVVSNAVKTWDGAFIFEYQNNTTSSSLKMACSFGKFDSRIEIQTNPYSYQTSKSYNGTTLNIGTESATNVLSIALARKGNPAYAGMVMYALCIIDHDTTPEERQKVIDKWKMDYPELF